MSTFDFPMLYTKITHEKLLYVLNEITDLDFKDGIRDYVAVYNLETFWSQSKSKTGRSYFPRNKILFGVVNKQWHLPGMFKNLSSGYRYSCWVRS